ncbi:hypothetical protein TNCV_4011761 [Trichonephila clavipes]|nr:hypothetical protein TNCV_4011761 [Trichonephila clavipes]
MTPKRGITIVWQERAHSCLTSTAKHGLKGTQKEEDDLTEFITVYENKDIDNEEVDCVQAITSGLLCKGMKFAASIEQHFLTNDPDIKRSIKFIRNHKFCIGKYQRDFPFFTSYMVSPYPKLTPVRKG